MKKIFTTILASVAILVGVQAQNHNLHIHFADGSTKVYHVEDIDSLTFVEAVDYSNLTFDIKVSNITSNGATTTVSANRPDVLFYSEAFKRSYFDTYTPDELAQGQLEYMYEDWLENGEAYKEMFKEDYGIDITFADFFCPGSVVDEYTYDVLKPNTDYVVLAFGVDLTTLEVVGTPDTLGFTTLAPEPSDNNISFSVANDTLYITTTNNDPYMWTYFNDEELAEYGEGGAAAAWDGLVEELDAIGYMDYFISSGSEANALKSYFYGAPGKYTIVAAGWNGVRTTDYFTFELTVTNEQAGGASAGLVSAKKTKPSMLQEGFAHSPKKMYLCKFKRTSK